MNSAIRYIARVRHSPRITPEEIRSEEWSIIRHQVADKVSSKTAGRCFYCGECLDRKWHVDHFHPLSKGGTDAIENLFPSCNLCNGSKGAFTLEEWRLSRRLKIAREFLGVPSFTRHAIEWLFARGVDVTEGVPPYDFWFETEGYETPAGATGNNEAPEWVKAEALRRIREHKAALDADNIAREAAKQGCTAEEIEEQVQSTLREIESGIIPAVASSRFASQQVPA